MRPPPAVGASPAPLTARMSDNKKLTSLGDKYVKEINKYCSLEFEKYHECMATKRPAECETLHMNFQDCIYTKVPLYLDFKKRCTASIDEYKDCLQKNTDHARACASQLAAMRDCAADV
ncbi:uncharacterized protein V1510DRAFT_413905 [Dipodascopsis tothii]|uniref:uncharacterized protein n=1 Tax=Dipodascopsis tothii TaxID=44089 RepID=UPI0034CDDDE1